MSPDDTEQNDTEQNGDYRYDLYVGKQLIFWR